MFESPFLNNGSVDFTKVLQFTVVEMVIQVLHYIFKPLDILNILLLPRPENGAQMDLPSSMDDGRSSIDDDDLSIDDDRLLPVQLVK